MDSLPASDWSWRWVPANRDPTSRRRPARPAGAPRDGPDASLGNAWLSASTVWERWRFELLAGAPERAQATARASLERFQPMRATNQGSTATALLAYVLAEQV